MSHRNDFSFSTFNLRWKPLRPCRLLLFIQLPEVVDQTNLTAISFIFDYSTVETTAAVEQLSNRGVQDHGWLRDDHKSRPKCCKAVSDVRSNQFSRTAKHRLTNSAAISMDVNTPASAVMPCSTHCGNWCSGVSGTSAASLGVRSSHSLWKCTFMANSLPHGHSNTGLLTAAKTKTMRSVAFKGHANGTLKDFS